MPKRKETIRFGFTLVELLMVIAVIAGLATMFISTYPASQKRGRDTIRKSDLKQYQTALELYANRQASGSYPINTTAGGVNPSSLCTPAILNLSSSSCPSDPRDGMSGCSGSTCRYRYVSNAAGTSYALWTFQEAPSNTANPVFVVCSTGITKENTTSQIPSSANTCP